MKNFYSKLQHLMAVCAILMIGSSFVQAQNFIFHAEFVNNWTGAGYNFNDDISNYPSVTVQATSTDDEFIIEADNYYNKWDNYGTCIVNTPTPFVFYGNTPSYDPGNSFLTDSIVIDRYYTVRLKNMGYNSTEAIIMETDSMPVTFAASNAITQLPAANGVGNNVPVIVTVTLSKARCAQEKVYIRYTSDSWTTSDVVEVAFANFNDLTGTATIPGMNSGVQVDYYAMTSTVDALLLNVSDYDLITLRQETNSGANYSYIVQAPPVGLVNVTFRVNMSNQTVSPQGVFLAGSFNNFNATADSMLPVGNNIYELTLSLDTTSTVQYKFVNGNTFETGNSACGVDDSFGGYNRELSVPENDFTLPLVCFNECSDCMLPGLANVTFRVNMSSQTVSPQGVFLAGSFNNFNATADSMLPVGNNIYELTLSLDTTSTVQYKFVNGNTFETGNSACGVDDNLGGYNRELSVPENDFTLPLVCFNECSDCMPVGVNNIRIEKLTVYPVPAHDQIGIGAVVETTGFEIYNISGMVVKSGFLTSESNMINISNLANGFYTIKTISNNKNLSASFIKN